MGQYNRREDIYCRNFNHPGTSGLHFIISTGITLLTSAWPAYSAATAATTTAAAAA